MPIVYHERSQCFHLYNKEISYIFSVLENGSLGHIYYGKVLQDRKDFPRHINYARRDMGACFFQENAYFSMEHLQQEYPSNSGGDMRYPAWTMEDAEGSFVSHFHYVSHKIYQGKEPMVSLPGTYVNQPEDGTTLEITLKEEKLAVWWTLYYTIYEKLPVICRHVKIENRESKPINIHRCMSGSVDLPNDKNFHLVSFCGAWSRERHPQREKICKGVKQVYSLRGCSSHQYNPSIFLETENATEDCGEVYGFSLVYSGDFLGQVELDNFGIIRTMMGIHPEGFSWTLRDGETFETPELIMAYSSQGRNHLSQSFHTCFNQFLVQGVWKNRPRPILLNSWEAAYFSYTQESLLCLAKEGAKLGVELFVIDDGWFGKRNDDTSSLGDWEVNEKKFPSGLGSFSSQLKKIGMQLGIWIEPEMVNKNSSLYREHPEWLLVDPSRTHCSSRNQYVLDYTKEEVIWWVYQKLKKVLKEGGISYVKWDMNRSITEPFSVGSSYKWPGEIKHRYILGVYQLYRLLTQEFPEILFESCASGGARFDLGMLHYAPQCWTSDNTDAAERVKIQYGTSFIYPLSSIGSHVSASPNHQTHRNISLTTRGIVAFFGTFGYELDLGKETIQEKEKIKAQIAFMKQYRSLLQYGDFYRLRSPFTDEIGAWMVVSQDQKTAIAACYRQLYPSSGSFERVFLRGLKEKEIYDVSEYSEETSQYCGSFGADELMYMGFDVSDGASGIKVLQTQLQGDFLARMFIIKQREEQKDETV